MTAFTQGRQAQAGWAPGAPVKPPARAHPAAVLAVIAAGGLAAIALWWTGTPPIHGLGDWLTNAGRLTGLACGYGVVVLRARETMRVTGLDRSLLVFTTVADFYTWNGDSGGDALMCG